MLAIEHSGDHPGLTRPQPGCLFDQRHCVAEDQLPRVVPELQISRIGQRVNLIICVCNFAEGLQKTFIRLNTGVIFDRIFSNFRCKSGTVIVDQITQASGLVEVLERADMLIDAGFGHAKFLRDHLDRDTPVNALHNGALPIGKPASGFGRHLPLQKRFSRFRR